MCACETTHCQPFMFCILIIVFIVLQLSTHNIPIIIYAIVVLSESTSLEATVYSAIAWLKYSISQSVIITCCTQYLIYIIFWQTIVIYLKLPVACTDKPQKHLCLSNVHFRYQILSRQYCFPNHAHIEVSQNHGQIGFMLT